MTETAPLLTVLEREEDIVDSPRLRSAGREVVGVDVTVRREDGSLCDAREVGEVVVRGPNIMLGYWNKDDATADVLRDGWYWTRDVGYLDEEGYLFLVDRAKDMIISGGENVYSIEVEDAVMSHPAILDCAVIGVPDDHWGERVHAVVVLHPGASLDGEELVEFCKGRIAGYKCPRSMEIASELPRSAAGKVLKRDLRDPHWAGHRPEHRLTTMDFDESTEHSLLRSSVASIAGSFGHAYFAEKTRRGEKTDELWSQLAAHGFLSVHLPAEHGGGDGGIQELAIVCEEVAAAGCPLLLMVVSAAICGEVISHKGTDEQKKQWLPALAEGSKMAFAITEPDAGSNSHNIATAARRDGDVYRLTGTKTYISGVDEAAAMVVVARTSTTPAGRARLSLFIVDTASTGLEQHLIATEVGIPEKQFILHFDDVVVPAQNLLGEEHEGLRAIFTGLNPERITSAAICTGIGRYALARASEYTRERRVWDVPIGAHQGVAHPLAEAKIELELARLMTTKAAWTHDRVPGSEAAGEAANMAKYASAEAGLRCLDASIQAHGGNGMASEYGLADLWGLARLLRIAPVSREMILNFVAQHSLGLPKSY